MELSGHPDDPLAAKLASGATWDEAAKACNVSRTTIHRRLQDPEFRERIASIRRMIVDRGVGLLADAVADVITDLKLIASSGDVEGNRLRAGIALLEFAKKYFTDADHEERLKKVEERLGLRNRETGEGGEGIGGEPVPGPD